MSAYDEFPLRKAFAYSPEYWGEPKAVTRIKKNELVVRSFDIAVGRRLIENYLEQTPPTESAVTGYNFYPANFAVGTIFRYRLEAMGIGERTPPSNFTAILLPTDETKKLYAAKPRSRGKIKLAPAVIASNPLIVGTATESYDKNGNPSLERLHSLEICEDSAREWEDQQARLAATLRGKILKNFDF